jgi:hypothetical protein
MHAALSASPPQAVLIPVPMQFAAEAADWAQRIWARLGDASTGATPTSSATPATDAARAATVAATATADPAHTGLAARPTVRMPNGATWDEERTHDLVRHGRCESAEVQFNHIADLAGAYASQSQLVAISGVPLSELHANLRWLGRQSKKVNNGVAGWPLLTKRNRDGEWTYAMPPLVAEWWRST